MLLTDYHVHIERGPYTRDWLNRFIEQAQKVGIQSLGISEHAYRFHQTKHLLDNPWVNQRKTQDLDEYINLIQEAKKDCGIDLKLGIEMDWMPENSDDMKIFLKEYPFDYSIGSIHWLGGFGFDLEEMKEQWKQGKVEDIYQTYFSLLEQMIEQAPCTIIGHADVIKVFGFKSSVAEYWYKKLTPKIKDSKMRVEVSTAGWRKPVREIYPNPNWIRRLVQAGVPLVLSSDAHKPEDVGAWYPEALDLLTASNCINLAILD